MRARVGVDDIEGFLRSHRLRWTGHVERAGEGVLKQVREMKVEGTRKKGRPRLTWQELVRKDMREVGLNREMAGNRAESVKQWWTLACQDEQLCPQAKRKEEDFRPNANYLDPPDSICHKKFFQSTLLYELLWPSGYEL